MSNNGTLNLTGTIPFYVAEQKAESPWQQELNRRFIEMGGKMPEMVKYQCRIATDARAVFERVDLSNGETLTLHPKAKPQFGEATADGEPYLTVPVIYSGDGLTYRVQWKGKAVPERMARVAIKHDQGAAVKATTINLDLAAATVISRWKLDGFPSAEAYAEASKRKWAIQRTTPEQMAIKRAHDDARRSTEKRAARSCVRVTSRTLGIYGPATA